MEQALRDYLTRKKVESIVVPSSLSTDYASFKEIVSVYDEEGYDCMTGDHIRNRAYQAGIRAVLEEMFLEKKKPLHVTEIGPGADACLTQMVAATGVAVVYRGVEGNQNSVRECQKRLTVFNEMPFQKRQATEVAKVWQSLPSNAKQQTFEILHAMSTDTDNKVLRQWLEDTEVLLQEVIGFVASREGIVWILHDIMNQRKLKRLPEMTIPSTIATLFVPSLVNESTLRVANKSFANGVRQILGNPNALLVQPFPFTDSKTNPMWPQCGLLEAFDFTHNPALDIHEPFASQSEFVNRSGGMIAVNSLACFLHVGFETPKTSRRGRQSKRESQKKEAEEQKEPMLFSFNQSKQKKWQDVLHDKSTFFTTCNALPSCSVAWANLVLFFSKIELQPTETLLIQTSTTFDAGIIPIYSFTLSKKDSDSKQVIVFA